MRVPSLGGSRGDSLGPCGAAEFVFFGGYVKCSDPLKGLDFRVNPKGPNT